MRGLLPDALAGGTGVAREEEGAGHLFPGCNKQGRFFLPQCPLLTRGPSRTLAHAECLCNILLGAQHLPGKEIQPQNKEKGYGCEYINLWPLDIPCSFHYCLN